ncbi:phosphomevalonate kinase [Spizellomyces punctatus DAOM BR117]|uniref:Phosphomevalonate kinase n=1 Tax=Spizellomyces punctatus (strain DAOM BR117) TaxID=645134 RepID=A0A0L0HR00_SPIPD|nr:phosphomevalonate kinase [Spizellomyces punctatus DAOM BR117]KND03269.1 phosphomevalonate kinase [Spizellomyces punctatus DAOM BR117]|eukprot:XP_016611308.1 phosphomevalonate kinase [Spizellomyces punctatus DAOM BR117]
MAVDTTIVSAPGKVLLTGGYLVLDQRYKGLVVATDSRFYVAIRQRSKQDSPFPTITVRSPQFTDGRWTYLVKSREDGSGIELTSIDHDTENRYVECTLSHTLEVVAGLVPNWKTKMSAGMDIVIVGSNDFYSQREQLRSRGLPLTSASLSSLPPFCSTLCSIRDVHKTGLGSSAAMITSLVGGILSHFGAIQLPAASISMTGNSNKISEVERYALSLAHNCAQLCHCLAQGKIGSGFDVSAAVFGNHSYRRFSPTVLDPLMEHKNASPSSRLRDLVDTIDPKRSHSWDNEVSQFHLPPNFTLMLADIDAGSSTYKLVSEVLRWRRTHTDEADALWTKLDLENARIEQCMRDLSRIAEHQKAGYESVLSMCAEVKASLWSNLDVNDDLVDVKNIFSTVYETFQNVRKYLREMSVKAGVPIEPPEQTRLLDACLDVPGVVMAGVPGAGGYDAIFCLVISETARHEVRQLWSTWTEMAVGPLLTQHSSTGLVRIDRPGDIPGLEKAMCTFE